MIRRASLAALFALAFSLFGTALQAGECAQPANGAALLRAAEAQMAMPRRQLGVGPVARDRRLDPESAGAPGRIPVLPDG